MKLFIRTVVLITIIFSITVMFGWLIGLSALTQLHGSFPSMKFTTALSFFFSGVILWFSLEQAEGKHVWADIMLPMSTMVVGLVMGTIALSVIFDFQSGIETLFAQESSEAVFTSVPGRPSLGTISAFMIITLLAVHIMSGFRHKRLSLLVGGLSVMVLGLIALIGFITGYSSLIFYGSDISNGMALHTAFLFFLIGIAFIFYSRVIAYRKDI